MSTATMNPTIESPNSRRARSSSTVSVTSTSSAKSKALKAQRKSSSLPAETVDYLKAWMMSPEHVAHPYPTEQEKTQIMADTGIELKQLTNWFVNNRKRFWKPRVEARLQQQAQAQAAVVAVAAASIAHVVSPAVERQTYTVAQQVGAPYLALDMTQPSVPVPTSAPPVVPSVPAQTSTAQPTTIEACPTIIPSDNFTAFINTAVRAVSDASSSSSSGSDESSSSADSHEEMENEATDEVDETTGMVTRSESVDLHILRPISGEAPTIEDVTVLSSVPTSRIVRSYHNCMMAYTFPQSMLEDRRKVQSRRDGEVVRIKKHFLKVFLNESVVPTVTAPIVAPTVRVTPAASPAPKRKREEIETVAEAPIVVRQKFTRKNEPQSWRGACIDASHFSDSALPSLEEAAHLFGYSQQ